MQMSCQDTAAITIALTLAHILGRSGAFGSCAAWYLDDVLREDPWLQECAGGEKHPPRDTVEVLLSP